MQRRFVSLPRWFITYYGGLLLILGATGMHIPDGYLSPVICIILFALVLPFWVVGVHQLQAASTRSIPLIALMAAFSFVVMMFNIPLPGGTTGHAVGSAIAALVFGPGVATITVSIALVIQAFLFGDGGVLALGANCLTMAVVMPYVAQAVYNVIASKTSIGSARRLIGAGVAGYVGLAVAALLTATLFGIQPALFTSSEGVPLYAPYPLGIAIPAMMIPHLLVACPAEALITTAVYAYLQRTQPQLLTTARVEQTPAAPKPRRGYGALWSVLIVMIILSPLGLLAPGTAWGEWGTEELTQLGLRFIPEGLNRLSTLWGAPVPDYDIPALGNVNLSYLLSAVLGAALTIMMVWLFGRLAKRDR